MSETVVKLCEFEPGDIVTESFTWPYRLRHIPTGASASDWGSASDSLAEDLRNKVVAWLAIEVLSKTMNEDKWQRCPVAEPMLKFLNGRAQRRKLRLFACAMSRLSVHLLVGLDGERLLREAEDAVDRNDNEARIPLSSAELKKYAVQHSISARGRAAQRGEVEACHLLQSCRAAATSYQSDWLAAWQNAAQAQAPFLWMDPNAEAGGPADQVAALRDVFGNPFRAAKFSALWRTPTALALAISMYESRDFGAMPILGDALEEAGCDNTDVLDHCRAATSHVRGCWVVDLLLEKLSDSEP